MHSDTLCQAQPRGARGTNPGRFALTLVMSLIKHIQNVFTMGRGPGQRGFVAEWTITLLLVFFGTNTLVRPT